MIARLPAATGNEADAATSRRIQVWEACALSEGDDGGTCVMTGKEAAYPPQKEHYIGKPMAEFQAPLSKGTIIREYCNINGLWEYAAE